MPQPRRAFTLIELLVVLAIIAVLTGLLLGVVGMVRSTAQSTRCLANLRQVSLSATAYAGDWRGALPPSIIDFAHLPDIFWFGMLAPYLEASKNGSTQFYDVQTRSVVVGCPAFKRDPAFLWDCGYGMNAWPLEPDRPQATTRYTNYVDPVDPIPFNYGKTVTIHVQRLTRTTTRPLFGDSYYWELAPGLNSSQDAVPRHRTKLSAAYCDGHVALVTPPELRAGRDAP